MKKIFILSAHLLILLGCKEQELEVTIYQTSSSGDKLTLVDPSINVGEAAILITLDPTTKFQEITGFGGSFTESSAHLLNQISAENRHEIINAYFGNNGAQYSLTRTHMNSCDFSLDHYSYAPVIGDTSLINFSIKEDMDDIIPMIKDAQEISEEGFKIVSSPWTAPPWMKDNNDWNGGKLLPEY